MDKLPDGALAFLRVLFDGTPFLVLDCALLLICKVFSRLWCFFDFLAYVSLGPSQQEEDQRACAQGTDCQPHRPTAGSSTTPGSTPAGYPLRLQPAPKDVYQLRLRLVVSGFGLSGRCREHLARAHERVWQPVARAALGIAQQPGGAHQKRPSCGVERQVYRHRYRLHGTELEIGHKGRGGRPPTHQPGDESGSQLVFCPEQLWGGEQGGPVNVVEYPVDPCWNKP